MTKKKLTWKDLSLDDFKIYFFSKKDVILVEAFKSDGIKILKKYNDLYQINDLRSSVFLIFFFGSIPLNKANR